MRVGHTQVVLEAVPGGKELPGRPHPQVPLAHAVGGVVAGQQAGGEAGVAGGETAQLARGEHTRPHPRAHRGQPSQQRGAGG